MKIYLIRIKSFIKARRCVETAGRRCVFKIYNVTRLKIFAPQNRGLRGRERGKIAEYKGILKVNSSKMERNGVKLKMVR